MTSSKLSHRRSVPVRPHICHAPPGVPILPPPPVGDYWILPEYQIVTEGDPAMGKIYASNPAYDEADWFPVEWDIPCGEMTQGLFIYNHSWVWWEWDSWWASGEHTITAHIKHGDTELAVLNTTIKFESMMM